MALFYQQKKRTTPQNLSLTIEGLDYQGRGIAKSGSKTWFVENALIGEEVQAKVIEDKRQYAHAQAIKILKRSPLRLKPSCPHFQQCGGCQLQYMPHELQLETKRQALEFQLKRLQAEGIEFSAPLTGSSLHYRRRLRLSANYDKNRQQLDIGFRQQSSKRIVNITQCDVLTQPLGELIEPLRTLFTSWQDKGRIGHIELFDADNGVAMLLRHIGTIPAKDRQSLIDFATQHKLMLFVDNGKTLEQLLGEQPYYTVNGIKLYFTLQDFIQVNAELNQKMIETAIEWLNLNSEDRLLDLFSGIGNFTLPLAPFVAEVVGVEGVDAMVTKAENNAKINNLSHTKFYQADLAHPFANQAWAAEKFNKILLDPPRSGADFVLANIPTLQAEQILYISCNPATLIRDAKQLIEEGYEIRRHLLVDMFPQTRHAESVTLFTRKIN